MYRYSDRLASLAAEENPFSLLLTQMRASGRPLLDLTISNPTEALAGYPHGEISQALRSIPSFRYQPDPFGNLDTRNTIAQRLETRSGIQISPDHLALTCSTSEGYSLLFKLLANPGDEILVPAPSYPLFDYLAHLDSVKLRTYQLRYDGSWFIDFASLETVVSARTRAIILVNPNNPTGSFLHHREYERLCDFALTHHLPLISDEVFEDYAFAESAGRVTTLNGRHQILNFTLNGLSKSCGMPQMKLGWLVVNGPIEERLVACKNLELIVDTYLSVSAPVQLAAAHLLEIGDSIRDRIRLRTQRNLELLDELTANTGVQRLHSEGGWSSILRVSTVWSEEEWITRLLRDRGVIVQPGYFFDMPGEAFLVISLLTPEDVFRSGVQQIIDLANTL